MRTNEEWKAIFADHEASGMTVKEYCKEHNIGVASFYKYKKLIMQSDELFNQATVIDEEPVSTMIEFQIDGHTINCDIKYLHLIVSAL